MAVVVEQPVESPEVSKARRVSRTGGLTSTAVEPLEIMSDGHRPRGEDPWQQRKGSPAMSVTKIIEVVGRSTESSDAAVKNALAEASTNLRYVKALDVVSIGLRGDNLDEWGALVRISFLVDNVTDRLPGVGPPVVFAGLDWPCLPVGSRYLHEHRPNRTIGSTHSRPAAVRVASLGKGLSVRGPGRPLQRTGRAPANVRHRESHVLAWPWRCRVGADALKKRGPTPHRWQMRCVGRRGGGADPDSITDARYWVSWRATPMAPGCD